MLRNRTSRQKTWKVLQRLSLLQLIPLGLVLWGRGCARNYQLESYRGKEIQFVTFSPDGKRVYGSGENTIPTASNSLIASWDVTTGKQLWKQESDQYLKIEEVSPSGERLLLTRNRVETALLDARTGTVLYDIPNDSATVLQEACFSPSGKQVVIFYSEYGERKSQIDLWDLSGKKPTRIWRQKLTYSEYSRPVWVEKQNTILITYAKRWVGSTETNGGVELRRLSNGALHKRLAQGAALCSAVSTKQDAVLIGGQQSRNVSLYDLNTGRQLAQTQALSRSKTLAKLENVLVGADGLVQARLLCEDKNDYRYIAYAAHLYWPTKTEEGAITHVHEIRHDFGPDEQERGGANLPNSSLSVECNTGNGKEHPPLLTLRDRNTGTKVRDFEGVAGWYPKD